MHGGLPPPRHLVQGEKNVRTAGDDDGAEIKTPHQPLLAGARRVGDVGRAGARQGAARDQGHRLAASKRSMNSSQVGIVPPLHFPLPPAAWIAWISVAQRAREWSESSSMRPFQSPSNPRPGRRPIASGESANRGC